MPLPSQNESSLRRSGGFRRQRVVNQSFQWKLTAWMAGGVFAVAVLMCLAILWTVHWQDQVRLSRTRAYSPAANTAMLIGAAVAFAGVMATGFVLWTAAVTRRIFGPLMAVKGFMATLQDGRFPKHRPLRKKDEFTDFYAFFWETVDMLRARKETEADALAKMLDQVRSLDSVDADRRRRDVAELTTQISSLHDEARAALGDDRPCSTAPTHRETEPVERAQHREHEETLA